MRIWKTLLILGTVGAVLTLLAYGFTTDPRAIPSTLTGKAAPDFSLTLFDGREVRLSDFRGKVVFLNFLGVVVSPVSGRGAPAGAGLATPQGSGRGLPRG